VSINNAVTRRERGKRKKGRKNMPAAVHHDQAGYSSSEDRGASVNVSGGRGKRGGRKKRGKKKRTRWSCRDPLILVNGEDRATTYTVILTPSPPEKKKGREKKKNQLDRFCISANSSY